MCCGPVLKSASFEYAKYQQVFGGHFAYGSLGKNGFAQTSFLPLKLNLTPFQYKCKIQWAIPKFLAITLTKIDYIFNLLQVNQNWMSMSIAQSKIKTYSFMQEDVLIKVANWNIFHSCRIAHPPKIVGRCDSQPFPQSKWSNCLLHLLSLNDAIFKGYFSGHFGIFFTLWWSSARCWRAFGVRTSWSVERITELNLVVVMAKIKVVMAMLALKPDVLRLVLLQPVVIAEEVGWVGHPQPIHIVLCLPPQWNQIQI